MSSALPDYEKMGSFYLGKEFDADSQTVTEEKLLYKSKDLVTHGAVLGMTGSGKTGLCLALLEEAVMDDIPAIVVDPKGDIANLLLAFPDMRGEDFEPWVDEVEAARKSLTKSAYAEKTAQTWKNGLAEWEQTPERVRQFRDRSEVTVFTPGSKAGIPVSVLSSLKVPPFEILDDSELFGERIESTVASLMALVGLKSEDNQSPETILLSQIFQNQWQKEIPLTLEGLIRHITSPPFEKIGVLDLETFISAKERQNLALKFNALLASPGFQTWLEGPPLEVSSMLSTKEGRPKVSIFNVAHLSDDERLFFVSLLFNQMLGWMRQQNGTTSLRALLYMDEIYGYLPPTANPPTKKPLLTILKQGRAFGLGVLVATQNPVDLDYKALSNIGTWFLGRLQTEQDVDRVLSGLEGAANSSGFAFSRREVERLLSGLKSRVFLMNNVHEDAPILFHVRWVMSYLCGPLARRQIKALMDPRRAEFEQPSRSSDSVTKTRDQDIFKKERPVVALGVDEFFVPFAGSSDGVTYHPAVFREAVVHFSSTKAKTEGSRTLRSINPIYQEEVAWQEKLASPVPFKEFEQSPRKHVEFTELPGFALESSFYKEIEDDWEDEIYRQERVSLFFSPKHEIYSKFGESEGEFRARLQTDGREARDAAIEKLEDKYEARIKRKEDQVERAEMMVEKEEAEAKQATMSAGVSILGGLLGGLFGGRKRRGGFGSASRAMKQRSDVGRAERKVAGLEDDLAELEEELRQELEELRDSYDATTIDIETITVKPYKKDIDIKAVGLAWIAFDERGEIA